MGYSRAELHRFSADGSKKLNEAPEWHPISTRAQDRSEEDPDSHYLRMGVWYDGDFIMGESSRTELLKAGRTYYSSEMNPPVETGWFYEFRYVPAIPEEGTVHRDMTRLRGNTDQFGDLELHEGEGDQSLKERLQAEGGTGNILETLDKGLPALASETEQDSLGIYFFSKAMNPWKMENVFLRIYLNGEDVFTLEEGYF
jgi:hypothetical protein